MKKGNIPDGIQLIGKDKKDVMHLIEKKIKEIKEDDPNKKEAIQKAIICIIIEMFRIPIEIFRIQNLNREELIDSIINIICVSSIKFKGFSDDQQKAMNPIVRTVMGFFPSGEFKDVNNRLYKLLNNYLKGYLGNSALENPEAQNAEFEVPDKVDMTKRNTKMSEKQEQKLIKNTKPDVPQFPTSSSKQNSVMNQGLISNVKESNESGFTPDVTKYLQKLKTGQNEETLQELTIDSKIYLPIQKTRNHDEVEYQLDLEELGEQSQREDCSMLQNPNIDQTVEGPKSNQLSIKKNFAKNEQSKFSSISKFFKTTNKNPITIDPSMDENLPKPLTSKRNQREDGSYEASIESTRFKRKK
jgi:hypothetical protein